MIEASQNNGVVGLQFANSCNICLVITAVGNGPAGDYSYSIATTHSAAFAGPSFAAFPNPAQLSGGGGSAPLYSWTISSYAPNGDVLGMTDSVMGTWSYNYDDFNRLTSGTASGGNSNGLALSWTYDRYGNRWAQNASCNSPSCTGDTAAQPQLTFGNNNQVAGWVYDADGNLLNDGRNTYAYDAEGRLITLNGQPTYRYDAEGRRVAKLGSNGSVTSTDLLGLDNQQVTELNGSGQWLHSNAYAGRRLVATYEGPSGTAAAGYHFHLTDWLGTERMQTTSAGNQEEVCTSYPFGDGLNCTGPSADATEQHFTGKERDAESGLDYFFARYYSSDLARFMTPDWAAAPTAVPYATFGDPQTLNLYAYVNNNPNTGIDLDGHVGSDQVSDSMAAEATASAAAADSAGDNPDDSPDCSSLPTNPLSALTSDEKSAIETSVDQSSKPDTDRGGDDKKGGYHEEGGQSWGDGTKPTVAPAVPGPASNPAADKKATVDPHNAADPTKQKPENVQARVDWHVHPGGIAVTMGGKAAWFLAPPSPADRARANAKLNIVVSAGNGYTGPATVYVFDKAGTTCHESYGEFKK